MTAEARFRIEVARLFSGKPMAVRRVAAVLRKSHGRFRRADEVARHAGLRNRHELNTLLINSRTASLSETSLIIRVLWWSIRWEEERVTLSQQASDESRYESQLSREVVRALGTPWSEVRQQGTAWVVQQARARLFRA